MRRIFVAVALALTAWAPAGQTASAGHLTTVDIGGAGSTLLYGINSKGQVAGLDGSAFVLEKDGTVVSWTVPSAFVVNLAGINVHGEVAGTAGINCGDGTNCKEGFFRSADGAISTFFASGQPNDNTGVSAINAKGQTAGEFADSSHLSRGFIRQPDGTVRVVDAPGANFTSLTALNDRGYAAGSFNDGAWHGLLVAPNGKQTVIDIPGAQDPGIVGLNNDGWITGWYYNDDYSASTGYVRAPDGTITPINIDGASYVITASINKSGDVAGYYRLGKHIFGFVRWSSGEITTIKVKRGSTEPACIDDHGRVVGTYLLKERFGSTKYYGFIWRS